MSVTQLAVEYIITKTFSHYAVTLDITDNICTAFKSKLWRMSRRISGIGGTKQKNDLMLKWKEGRGSVRNFTINEYEVGRQILTQK